MTMKFMPAEDSLWFDINNNYQRMVRAMNLINKSQ
jgi:hypothetical protein